MSYNQQRPQLSLVYRKYGICKKKIIFFEFIVQIKVFLKVILLKNRRLVQCLVIIGEVFELLIFLV